MGKIRAPGSPDSVIPKAKHFVYANGSTGRSAVVLLSQVLQNESIISDRSEIGVFDASGTLVGSGVVMNGKAAFTVWGDNTMTKEKDGLVPSEPLSFKVWTPSGNEYAADFTGTGNTGYADNAILRGSMTIHHTAFITRSALSGVYPNPFKGNVRIGFDVAAGNGNTMQDVEVTIVDVRGKLVCRLVKGMYTTGRYSVTWDGSSHIGSTMYIVMMKTGSFSQSMTLFKVK